LLGAALPEATSIRGATTAGCGRRSATDIAATSLLTIDSLLFCIHVMSVIAARRIAQCTTPGGAC
jgi:hypothetical protein